MSEIEFAPASFDGVIAFDSIWHVPRPEHEPLFRKICGWLAPRGAALFTLAGPDETEWVDGRGLFTELMGAPIFYDAWPRRVSLEMLGAAGLSVLAQNVDPDRAWMVLVTK